MNVQVSDSDRAILDSWANSTSIRAGLAQRARIVLLAAEGAGTSEITLRTGASRPTVLNWTRRYAAEGLGGLDDRQRPGRPRTADDVAIVLATLTPPPADLGARRWSSRLLAQRIGVSNVKIAAVWREYGLRPWRRDGLSFRTDPALLADICAMVGLYLGPEGRAVAVSRAPGARRAWPCAAESVAAAMAAARPRTAGPSLACFFEQIANASPGGAVHVVISGTGTGTGPAGHPSVRRVLAASPGIRLHAAPAPSIWLPLTEILVGIVASQSAGLAPRGADTPEAREAARAVCARLADLDQARVPLLWIAPPPPGQPGPGRVRGGPGPDRGQSMVKYSGPA